MALHQYLRSGQVPARDTLCIIGAVEAARQGEGLFAKRMPDGRRDLNRCFLEPPEDIDGELAVAILNLLRDRQIEGLVDVHNNTGHNPAYGVLIGAEEHHLAMVELFAPRCVLNTLRLGTLVEAIDPEIPSVVIECGQSGTSEADAVAYRGICDFLGRPELPDKPASSMQVFRNSMRILIANGHRPSFADERDPQSSLTLRDHIEQYNFKRVDPGTCLGWTDADHIPLKIIDAEHRDRVADFLELRDGAICTRRPIVPIMMTARPEVALSDCLCYLVEEC
jgi:hypothetical protein